MVEDVLRRDTNKFDSVFFCMRKFNIFSSSSAHCYSGRDSPGYWIYLTLTTNSSIEQCNRTMIHSAIL